MSETAWSNLLTYALQLGLLVGVAGWIPAATRLRSPKARLAFFQLLLAACLLLPVAHPWRTETIALEPLGPPERFVTGTKAPPVHTRLDPHDVIFAMIALGIAARLGMLAVGMARLRGYRLRSTRFDSADSWLGEADIRTSDEISGPVTFGFLRPVILLPAHFPELGAEMREAILCHETLHVRRRDWLFTAAEELIRAGLWFHPAIWWLLGEIQLAREQAVDREAIGMTNAREPYVDALLAAAGAAIEPDLAPAPLFLRKRHLKERVVSILKEKRMSKKRTVSTLAASLALLAGACWYLSGALPLSGEPQIAPDSPGITVDLMGSPLMHRAPVRYPAAAIENKVEGTVVAQVTTDQTGNVSDAKVLSGPDELRRAVLESLLSWHFTKDAAGSMRQIAVTFRLPEAPAAPTAGVAGGVSAGTSGGVAADGVKTVMTVTAPAMPRATPFENRKSVSPMPEKATVRAITVQGMNAPEEQILSQLPLHVGDTWTQDGAKQLVAALHGVDEHLAAGFSFSPEGTVDIRIRPTASAPPPAPSIVNVGGRVQAAKLVSQVSPVYPTIARQARISGTVELATIIGPDGHVQDVSVISGHPLLRQASIDAVKQWVYQPTLLNEQPVSVSTTVDVIFQIEP